MKQMPVSGGAMSLLPLPTYAFTSNFYHSNLCKNVYSNAVRTSNLFTDQSHLILSNQTSRKTILYSTPLKQKLTDDSCYTQSFCRGQPLLLMKLYSLISVYITNPDKERGSQESGGPLKVGHSTVHRSPAQTMHKPCVELGPSADAV